MIVVELYNSYLLHISLYRNESFHSQESDTMTLSEHIFCLLGSHHQLLVKQKLFSFYLKTLFSFSGPDATSGSSTSSSSSSSESDVEKGKQRKPRLYHNYKSKKENWKEAVVNWCIWSIHTLCALDQWFPTCFNLQTTECFIFSCRPTTSKFVTRKMQCFKNCLWQGNLYQIRNSQIKFLT